MEREILPVQQESSLAQQESFPDPKGIFPVEQESFPVQRETFPVEGAGLPAVKEHCGFARSREVDQKSRRVRGGPPSQWWPSPNFFSPAVTPRASLLPAGGRGQVAKAV